MQFGEKQSDLTWGAELFNKMHLAEIEITGSFPRSYRGPVYAAHFVTTHWSGRRKVALSLNWIAERHTLLFADPSAWSFSGACTVLIDPEASPLRRFSDGALWFVWPRGGYAVISFEKKGRLAFSGDHATPRYYTYF